MLLAGTATILFAFGRFDYLGWKGMSAPAHPQMVPGRASAGQKACIKFFVVVTLFLAQVLVGAATAHSRAEPGSFYGLALYQWFPSNILRTWHLQLAIFWIATAYIAGGLFLPHAVGGKSPQGRLQERTSYSVPWSSSWWQLAGRAGGINQLLGDFLVLVRPPGMEYLDPTAVANIAAGRC